MRLRLWQEVQILLLETMKPEDAISLDPILEKQALRRFFYLHESRENVMAQLNITSFELEMILRKYKQTKQL
jgi:hypothetical protein